MVSVSKDAEIVELKERVEYDPTAFKAKANRQRAGKLNENNEKAFNKKRVKTDNVNSYATEGILKKNFDIDRAKQDPGFTQGKVHSMGIDLKPRGNKKPFSKPMYPELQEKGE